MPPHDIPSPVASDEDDLERFTPVLALLQLSEIPGAAARLWATKNPEKTLSGLPVVGGPLHGSYHILFPVEFPEQGAKWLLKIPINGAAEHWDELSAEQLQSEARTMQFIKRRTSIPLPEVFGFSTSLANPLGCPHIWLSFIPGVSLYDFWFNTPPTADDDDDALHRRRIQILKDVASAMVQLGQLRFPKGGRLVFDAGDDNGDPVGVGPQRQLDDAACQKRLMRDPPDYMPVYFAAGPFKTAREFYTCPLEREAMPPLAILAGQQRLLRFLLDCMADFFEGVKGGGEEFVLTHPDFDIQNFIVSPTDGRLVGIIDWDGVGAWPVSLGNLRYPGWLTRDWDPGMYGYGEDGVLADGVTREDSPETLQRCRWAYWKAVRDSLEELEAGQAGSREGKGGGEYETSATIITENLHIAAAGNGRANILKKIVDEIAAVVDVPCENGPEFFYMELAMAGQGEWKDGVKEALRAGLETLLRDQLL
ncbi:uncharacterized protein B0H64DRAFT_413623 [Chaetomium fimeti]|uniref:Aminoglycoside phosphotransferase domain-containing protein n=1 Tax=Chaetomium fimeti TaxID=1854472 RepID=A0AAE0H5D9_9PEZI|nr:hypothetical protein B0H64DRAFT_413623 [Chaetomium fimeti]